MLGHMITTLFSQWLNPCRVQGPTNNFLLEILLSNSLRTQVVSRGGSYTHPSSGLWTVSWLHSAVGFVPSPTPLQVIHFLSISLQTGFSVPPLVLLLCNWERKPQSWARPLPSIESVAPGQHYAESVVAARLNNYLSALEINGASVGEYNSVIQCYQLSR